MKNFIIISGARKSGKTYRMISEAVDSAIRYKKNVFIIAADPRAIDYFEHIIMEEYPSLKLERRKHGFMLKTPAYSRLIYCVPFCDIRYHRLALSLADEIMIDEYLTFTYLIKDKKIFECMQSATSVTVTISDYYFNSGVFGVIDVISNLGVHITVKRIRNG